MNILIATGIYPPATSGPAQYAAAMQAEFWARGHAVRVATYGRVEKILPAGVRHLWFLLKILGGVRRADLILALDTMSVGWPTALAAKWFKKKIILRTGGDFLYEAYTERTGDAVLLSQFYLARRRFSLKESLIFRITRQTLARVSVLVFSTAWQRDIWLKPYGLEKMAAAGKIKIIANRFDAKLSDEPAAQKNFIFATRNLKYKNIERFKTAFAIAASENPDITLEMYHDLPHAELMERIKNCWAVVMPSLGEISPHVILDALRCNRPFLLSRESGFAAELKNIGVLADPLSVNDLRDKILWLAREENWRTTHAQVVGFSKQHSWAEIADEILAL